MRRICARDHIFDEARVFFIALVLQLIFLAHLPGGQLIFAQFLDAFLLIFFADMQPEFQDDRSICCQHFFKFGDVLIGGAQFILVDRLIQAVDQDPAIP
jgi:hypothetical protein